MVCKLINIALCLIFLTTILASCSSGRNEIEDLLDRYENYDLNPKVQTWLRDLQQNDFVFCRSETCITKPIQEAIFQYERRSGRDSLRANRFGRSFSNIYTADIDDWNFSCIHTDDDPSPVRMIEFVVSSKNYVSIGYATGGLEIGKLLQTYYLNNREVNDHWTIRRLQDPNIDKSDIAELFDQLLKLELEVLR